VKAEGNIITARFNKTTATKHLKLNQVPALILAGFWRNKAFSPFQESMVSAPPFFAMASSTLRGKWEADN